MDSTYPLHRARVRMTEGVGKRLIRGGCAALASVVFQHFARLACWIRNNFVYFVAENFLGNPRGFRRRKKLPRRVYIHRAYEFHTPCPADPFTTPPLSPQGATKQLSGIIPTNPTHQLTVGADVHTRFLYRSPFIEVSPLDTVSF